MKGGPRGNQFWKLRSTHGRNKLFESPELLYQAACEYFQWCDSHPWNKNEAIKSGDNAGKIIKIPTQRPYTLSGLCLYLDASENFWREFRKNENLSNDFLLVIIRVEEIVRTQKFEGAAIGAFNANIIARDLGLADKTESRFIDKEGNDVSLFLSLSTDKLKAIEQILTSDESSQTDKG